MKASMALLALAVSLVAQDRFEYWPGASYDPGVPTEKQVSGHSPGERITRPEDMVRYMEALAAARPRQMRVFDYGKTWEAGVPDTVHVMASGRAIFAPIQLDKGVNAAYFAGPDQLLPSGYMWKQNRKQLAYKPFVVVQRQGRGNVIGFTEDPNFRGYMDGLNLLFLNAVFRGAAHAR